MGELRLLGCEELVMEETMQELVPPNIVLWTWKVSVIGVGGGMPVLQVVKYDMDKFRGCFMACEPLRKGGEPCIPCSGCRGGRAA